MAEENRTLGAIARGLKNGRKMEGVIFTLPKLDDIFVVTTVGAEGLKAAWLSTKDDDLNNELFFTHAEVTSGMPHLVELKDICPKAWELFKAKFPVIARQMEETYAHIKVPAAEGEHPQ
jgi:hypothetical protein